MSFQWSRADRSMGEGFLRIAREQIGKAIDGAEDSSEPPERRVHEARRRCKKLRALFRLVRPDFAAYDSENAFVRDAARGLAAARDMRVARSTLADLMAWAGRPIAGGPGDEEEFHAEGELAALAHFAAQMRELDRRGDSWNLDRIDLDTLTNGLKHTYRRGRKTRRVAERHRTYEAFHEWRKYAKYLWNQLGLLESCADAVIPSAHKCVGDLADQLGLHHDLAMLGQMLHRDPAAFGTGFDLAFALAAVDRRQAGIEAQITGLGRQAFAEKPRALRARFAVYLEGWMQREAAE